MLNLFPCCFQKNLQGKPDLILSNFLYVESKLPTSSPRSQESPPVDGFALFLLILLPYCNYFWQKSNYFVLKSTDFYRKNADDIQKRLYFCIKFKPQQAGKVLVKNSLKIFIIMISLFEERAELLENEANYEVEGNPWAFAVFVVVILEKCTDN